MQRSAVQESASKDQRPNRRQRYVVNSAFQWKYAATVSLLVFVISSVVSTVLYAVLHHQTRLRMMNPETYTAEVAMVVLGFALGFSLLTAGGVGVWCLLATHRICGPLYVFERYVRELAQGRFPNVRPLRKKDEFKELHAALADAVETLKSARQNELSVVHKAEQTAASALSGSDEDCRKALESLVCRFDELGKTLSEGLSADGEESHRSTGADSACAQRETVEVG